MNDLISRSALIRFIDVGHFRHPTELCYSELDVANLIKNFPAVDALPVVHGRWIEGKTIEKCSICGKKGFPDWHYCPNCGADMRERKEK